MADSERTEQATPRRREEARRKGEVAQSRDFSSAAVLAALFLLMAGGLTSLGASLSAFCQSLWSEAWLTAAETSGDAAADGGGRFFSAIIEALGPAIRPFLWFAPAVIAIPLVTAILQRGWLFLPDKVLPDPARLTDGRRRLNPFSADGFYQTTVGLLKLGGAAGIAFFFLRQILRSPEEFVDLSPSDFAATLSGLLVKMGLAIIGYFLTLAAADLFYQRWKTERDLRMTPEEVRREQKETEADPELKIRRTDLIRSIYRESKKN